MNYNLENIIKFDATIVVLAAGDDIIIKVGYTQYLEFTTIDIWWGDLADFHHRRPSILAVMTTP